MLMMQFFFPFHALLILEVAWRGSLAVWFCIIAQLSNCKRARFSYREIVCPGQVNGSLSSKAFSDCSMWVLKHFKNFWYLIHFIMLFETRFISSTLIPAKNAYIGLSSARTAGAWQTESKVRTNLNRLIYHHVDWKLKHLWIHLHVGLSVLGANRL